MNKKKLLLIALVIAGVAGYFVWDQMLRTAPSMKRLTAELTVSAEALFSDFEDDETAANAKYLNKIIEITGEVEGVEQKDGKPIISLKTGGFGTIRCTMESDMSAEELAEIKPNTSLKIRGECIGNLLDVDVNRCIVVQPS